VNFVEFFNSLNIFDLLVVLLLFGMFVLGFIQGTIRRLVGLLTMTFSFFLAAILSVPVGEFLAANWVYFPTEYSVMIGFGIVFVAAVIAFALVVQGTMQKQQLFPKYPVLDEVMGGVVGVCQGLLLLLFATIILDQYFLNVPAGFDNELGILRTFWEALNASGIGRLLHENVAPQFVSLFSFLIPDYIENTYAAYLAGLGG
jgi:uncharacterized membrane protein required for colicin V production